MALKLTFLAFKKVVQVVQIGGRVGGRGGGNLDKIKKNSSFFGPLPLLCTPTLSVHKYLITLSVPGQSLERINNTMFTNSSCTKGSLWNCTATLSST